MKPVYEATWDDHAFSPDTSGTVRVRSVGYLMRGNKRFIVLAQSYSKAEGYRERLTIDRRTIRALKKVR